MDGLDCLRLTTALLEAMNVAGWTSRDQRLFLESLTKPENLASALDIFSGCKIAVDPESIIDLEADPLPINGFTCHENIRYGPWRLIPEQVKLHPLVTQMRSKMVRGDKLCAEIKGKCLANGRLFGHYRKKVSRIPVKWQRLGERVGGSTILFPGTTYRRQEDGEIGIYGFSFIADEWIPQFFRLKELWGPNCFLAYIDPPIRT